jgi:hypothetical protein
VAGLVREEHQVALTDAVRFGVEQATVAAPGVLLRVAERPAALLRGGYDVQVLLVVPTPALAQTALSQLSSDVFGLGLVGSNDPVTRHYPPPFMSSMEPDLLWSVTPRLSRAVRECAGCIATAR